MEAAQRAARPDSPNPQRRRQAAISAAGQRSAFRQLHDTASGAFSYLLGDLASHAAVLVDPVLTHATLYLALIEELDLELSHVIDTHRHEDHASARDALRQACGATAVLGREAGAVDGCLPVDHGDTLRFGKEQLRVIATPGHTPGCISLLWRDRVLTGDALLIGGCGRTDLPGSDPGRLYDSLVRRLLTLADETLVYPGRDRGGRRVSCIGEEREHNPCVTGRSRDEFVAMMDLCRGAPDPMARAASLGSPVLVS